MRFKAILAPFFLATTITIVTNCNSPDGVPLWPGDGVETAKELGIPDYEYQISRVEHVRGGTHNRCGPSSRVAVLKNGNVYCVVRDEVDDECVDTRYQGQISRKRALELFEGALKELDSDNESDDSCDGAWSAYYIYDREDGLRYKFNTSCLKTDPMPSTRKRLSKIWDKECSSQNEITDSPAKSKD